MLHKWISPSDTSPPLSQIRLRGLSRTYITQLVREGYDKPETISEIPIEELERTLPKRLARRLHKYCQIHYGPKEPKPKETHPAKETWQVRPFSEIISNNGLLTQFRSHLALSQNLAIIVNDPPVILLDEKQNLFFYHGYQVQLAPTTFKLMALLAKKPGEVVTRNEIYSHLWPEFSSSDHTSNPYDRQISDHKRKILKQIIRAVETEIYPNQARLENLIGAKRKVGYMLYLTKQDVSKL
jgi:hypothetical protein